MREIKGGKSNEINWVDARSLSPKAGFSEEDVSENSSKSSPVPHEIPQKELYDEQIKLYKKFLAGYKNDFIHRRVIAERKDFLSSEKSSEELEMDQKTYGPRMASYLLRKHHRMQLNRLEQLSTSLTEFHPGSIEHQHVDALIETAKNIVKEDELKLKDQEGAKPKNNEKYQEFVGDIRKMIKNKNSREKIAHKMAEFQAFDENLRREYEGREPYGETWAGAATNWLKSWFRAETDRRVTPQELILEYSLSTHDLNSSSEIYQHVFQEMLTKLLQNPKALVLELGDEIQDFLFQHPVLAAQAGSQFAHTYGLMTGDSSAGLALQNLIYQQRIRHIFLDTLVGKKNRHAYEEEIRNPLTLNQIAFVHLMSFMPYLAGAYEGAQGRTFCGALGMQIAGSLGGVLGGLAQVKMQEVLSESLNRETEIVASLISSFCMSADPTVLANMKQAFSTPEPSWDQVNALYDFASQLKWTVIGEFGPRGQIAKAGEFVRNLRKEGIAEAVHKTAKGTVGTLGTEVLYEVAPKPVANYVLFSTRFFKVMKSTGMMTPEQVAQTIDSIAMTPVYDLVNWYKKIETDPEDYMKIIKPIIGSKNSVFIEDWRKLIMKTLYHELGPKNWVMPPEVVIMKGMIQVLLEDLSRTRVRM